MIADGFGMHRMLFRPESACTFNRGRHDVHNRLMMIGFCYLSDCILKCHWHSSICLYSKPVGSWPWLEQFEPEFRWGLHTPYDDHDLSKIYTIYPGVDICHGGIISFDSSALERRPMPLRSFFW